MLPFQRVVALAVILAIISGALVAVSLVGAALGLDEPFVTLAAANSIAFVVGAITVMIYWATLIVRGRRNPRQPVRVRKLTPAMREQIRKESAPHHPA